ncbi:MAG TPA: MMPL family transporter, partial [Acidimicrobiales bacterium]|nr:MMPL family transporter [Acidimicrobiales bacterium]
LPILLGVGIDYAIQMHSRIEEEVVLDRAAHPIQATARNLGPALLVVTFDAVFAFCALLFAKVPMIRQFGGLLVVGIIAVCIFSIIGPLAFLGIREFRSPTKGKDFSNKGLSALVVRLGSLPMKAAIPMMSISLLIFTGGLMVEGHLSLQTDPIQWVNPHSSAIQGIRALMAGTGSENELGVIVTSNQPFSDQTVNYVASLSDTIQNRYPTVLYPAVGLVNFVDQLVEIPGATTVVPTGAQVQQVYSVAPPAIRNLMVARNGSDLNVVFRARTSTLASLQPVVTYLQSPSNLHVPHGMTVAPGGIAVVGVGLLENLADSRLLLTYLAIAFVGGFLVLRLRSLVRSLLSLVPVLIAVGTVSLVADALSLKLSPMTAVAGPLVVAACTEFTSLILLRFVEERGRGLEPRQAVDMTAARTGRAFLVSAMTAVAGISVMATSSMPLLRGFGIIVGLNVAIALLCALVILPPVLVWADQPERLWVSRGLTISYEEPRTGPIKPRNLHQPAGV